MSAAPTSLDKVIETWARWVESGKIEGGAGGGLSILARWMDSKGDLQFGDQGGASSVPLDLLEQTIEGSVVKMATVSLDQADVLRLEFGAGIYQVCARRGIRGYDPRLANQERKATALGLSLRTYRRRLAEAKDLIDQALRGRLKG